MNDQQDDIPIYEQIGGAEKLKLIVDRFYQLMDSLSEARDIRLQHQADLSEANMKLNLFLTGWLGGPQLYIEKYGHPRLRARHLPFAIGIKERDQWLLCMFKALDEVDMPVNSRNSIKVAISRLADHMRNVEEITKP